MIEFAKITDITNGYKIHDKETFELLKQEIIKKFGIHENDTGSSPVQVALLTLKINYLTEHLLLHKKDNAARKTLIEMVHKRKKLLSLINKESHDNYIQITTELQIRISNKDNNN